MLKQSLVQEKLSDLSNSSSAAKSAVSSDLEPKTSSSNGKQPRITSRIKLNAVQPTGSILLANRFNNSANLAKQFRNHTTTFENNTNNANYLNGNNANNNDDDDSENVEFDGDETVNYYSSYNNNGRLGGGGNGSGSGSGGGGGGGDEGGGGGNNNNGNNDKLNQLKNVNITENSNGTNNNNSLNSNGGPSLNATNSNQNLKSVSKDKTSTKTNNNNNNNNTTNNNIDFTMKLRYLEKSIKFIQQQHNETLSSLHQEIEKLKTENRGKD